MSIVNITQSTNGVWDEDNSDYLTARNAVSSIVSIGTLNVGQWYWATYPTKYHIHRSVLIFDTSEIDNAALIISATLKLRISGGTRDTDFDVIIKNGMPTYPHNPVIDADYALTNYAGNGGSKNTGDLVGDVNEVFNISLNPTGKSWINLVGETKFALISSRDVGSDAPTGYEYISIANSAGTYYVILTVEYTIPTGIPAVGNPTYSAKATYAIATANVSDAGGGYEERGFEYGTSEEATWTVKETGVWGATGNYSLTLPNLLPGTTYYARARVTNDYGTGYSEWTSFTTTTVPSYGIYEETNTATICFYISEDDGMTWGQKHGPYTEDQADIEVTKLLVRGSGKKKIKFESDVLTGISASVLVKLDCKAR